MVTALFQRLAAAGRTAVERVHGDTVVVRPMYRFEGPNARREPDPDRSVFETVACFYENSANETGSDSQPLIPNMRQKLLHRSPKITASIRLSTVWHIRTGDIIERVDLERWYEITEINPEGLGGAMLTLAVAKGPAVA